MREISKVEFDAVVEEFKSECSEMISRGYLIQGVTTKDFPPLTGGVSTLTEYYSGGSLFGYIQNGRYYSNGL